MNNLKKSIMSVAMAAITAASPILSSYAAYASDITVNDDGTVTQMSTSTEGSTSKADETKFLFIKLKTAGGKVVLNEGEDQEQRIRMDKKTDGVEYIDVYDKNDVLISSESTKDNDYTYVYEAKADDAVNVKAKADEGYKVKLYELTDDSSGTEIAENVGFDAGNKVDSFKYPVFMEYDKTVKIGFEKTESADDIAKDLSVNDKAGKDKADEQSKAEADVESEDKTSKKDEAESKETEDAKADGSDEKHDDANVDEASNDEDLTVDTAGDADTSDTVGDESKEESEAVNSSENSDTETEAENKNEDLTIDSKEEINADDAEADAENTDADSVEGDADITNADADAEAKDEEENVEESVEDSDVEEPGVNAEETTKSGEHFAEISTEIASLDADLFSSARLVIMTGDAGNIVDAEHIIANYDNIYLMQYSTVEQAMTAYLYYNYAASTGVIDAVEPDAPLEAADEETVEGTAPIDETNVQVTADVNPISSIEETKPAETKEATNVIALIDTGVSESANVIDRVSLIGDELEGNGHGDRMLQAIVGQNADASVLSIRTMGNDGRGTVSSIIAGMEYAINQNVSIINLSMSAKLNAANSVLYAEIQKAIKNGIIVIGAAGNNGDDAQNYMPGSVDEAYIVGACDEDGIRLEGSNYGRTVDFNVIADTTSEAAAKFTGYASINGISNLNIDENNTLHLEKQEIENPDKPDIPDSSDKDNNKSNNDDVASDNDDEEWTLGDSDSYNENPEDYMEDDIWEIDGYPEFQSTNRKNESIWTRDKKYDISAYNPYDSNVKVECVTDLSSITDDTYADGNSIDITYKCSLLDTPEYFWTIIVTFNFKNDRTLATVCSDDAKRLLPSYINQNRNKGYTGVVPERVGDVVEGKTYTVLAGWKDFSLENILLDYNPHTFKVNGIDDNGFDINVPGTYTVTYEVSHFMYFDYSWYVNTTVNVIDPDSLNPGLYITSDNASLMMNKVSDNTYGGYGDLWEVLQNDNQYVISCYDNDYEVSVLSNNSIINPDDICSITDSEDGRKTLTVSVPDNLNQAVVLYLTRPNYHSVKMLTGGGWKTSGLPENKLMQFSEKDFEKYEDELSGESQTDEYMDVAAGWTTIKSKQYQVRVQAGPGNVTNYGWQYSFRGSNWGTVQVNTVASQIVDFAAANGITVKKDKLKNFNLSCTTGHSYMAMKATGWYTCNMTCYLQKSGNDARVMLYAYLHPASDNQGNYQTFEGAEYIEAQDGGKIRIYKMFRNSTIALETSRVGELQTVFGIYSSKSCSKSDLVTTLPLNVNEDGAYKVSGEVEVPVGKYYVKEIYRIPGCAENTDVYGPVPVKSGQTVNLARYFKDNGGDSKWEDMENGWIYNRPFYYQGELFAKIGKNSKAPVAGAVYHINYSAYDNDDTHKFKTEKSWYFKTDENGKVVYDDEHFLKTWKNPDNGKTYTSDDLIRRKDNAPALPIGYLHVKEAYAPEGFEKDNTIYTQRIQAITLTEYPAKITKLTIKEDETGAGWKVRVKAKKVDESGKGLAGAKFRIFTDEACTTPIQGGDENSILTSTSTGETNVLVIKDLLETQKTVTLYCKEIAAPNGYTITDEKFSLTFEQSKYAELKAAGDDSGELKTFGPETGIINKKGWTVRVHLKKIDKRGRNLADAVFKVYSDEACTKVIGEDLTSGEDGMTNIVSIGVPNDTSSITLWCKEYSAPKGYIPSSEKFTLTFDKKDYVAKDGGELKQFGPEEGIVNNEGKISPTPTPVTTPPTGAGLTVIKTSKTPDDMMALDSYTLEGAVFRVTSSRDGDMGTITTDASGYAGPLSLPDNSTKTWVDPATDKDGNVTRPGYWQINEVTTTYYITEETPPKGHENNYSRQSISVTMPRDADQTFRVTFTDTPKYNKASVFDIEKLGVKGEPIKGVVFKVEYFDGDDDNANLTRTWHIRTDESGHAKLDNQHLDTTQSSDPFYMYEGNIVIPIGGYLKITEEAAPAEYVLDEEPVGVNTVEGGEYKFTYANNNAWYNELQRCRVDLQKYEADGTTPIAGVEFEIKFLEAAIQPTSKKHPNFKRLLNVGDTLIRHTDGEGNVFFDNLDQGTYQITEIKTKDGNALLKEPIVFTLPFKMTTDEANEYGNVDFNSAKEDVGYTNKWYFYSCKYDITNNAVFRMPMTGDDGKWKYGFIGFGFIIVTGTMLIVCNKKTKKIKRKHKK